MVKLHFANSKLTEKHFSRNKNRKLSNFKVYRKQFPTMYPLLTPMPRGGIHELRKAKHGD